LHQISLLISIDALNYWSTSVCPLLLVLFIMDGVNWSRWYCLHKTIYQRCYKY